MPIHNPEFEAMRVQLQARFDREKDSLSPEEERATQLVLLALWTCAHNKKPLGVLLKGLADYTEALDRVRGTGK